jgi:hypothetical protein
VFFLLNIRKSSIYDKKYIIRDDFLTSNGFLITSCNRSHIKYKVWHLTEETMKLNREQQQPVWFNIKYDILQKKQWNWTENNNSLFGCCCSRFSFIVSSVRCHTLRSSNIYFMSVYLYVNINCVFLVKYSEVIDKSEPTTTTSCLIKYKVWHLTEETMKLNREQQQPVWFNIKYDILQKKQWNW